MTGPPVPSLPLPPDLLFLAPDPLQVSGFLKVPPRDTVMLEASSPVAIAQPRTPAELSSSLSIPLVSPSVPVTIGSDSSSPTIDLAVKTNSVVGALSTSQFQVLASKSQIGNENSTSPVSSKDPVISVPGESSKDYSWVSHLKSGCRIPKSSAPVTISPSGRPRVKIPNVVFERGAKIHSDFIVSIFYGNPPSYGKIWGVLNYLWGKDKRVTVHNLTKNAFLFYIPSPSLRRKVLLHELWRVGDSPFFVTEWKAEFSLNPPSLERAPIWATIYNIPFDLVTDEGLSYISRPLGQVVDAKPFKSISSADIKVIMDLTKPLPKEFEIEREDGKICLLSVSYPWLPPLCSVCNEIGHKESLCPKECQ